PSQGAGGGGGPGTLPGTPPSPRRSFGLAPDAPPSRLQRSRPGNDFSVTPESDGRPFDATDPLSGRWLRFWPWPYGEQKQAPLLDDVSSTPESRRQTEA